MNILKIKIILNLNNGGYPSLYLYNKEGRKFMFLHRLIAQTFIPNPNNLLIVEHIDDNPLNYNVNNLKWSTQTENIKKCYRVGGRKPSKYWQGKIGNQNPNSKKIQQLDLYNNLIKIWYCAMDIQRKLKINNSSIIQVCKNKRKTAGGFKWKYL